MAGELHLRLLGPPEIVCDGVPVTRYKYRKSLALLSYLAVTGRPHSRGALAGLLWGEANESNARAGLRKVLAELRGLVGDHLQITRADVAFDREQDYWLDIEGFDRRVLQIQVEHGVELASDIIASLVETSDLYRDEFLAGFQIQHAPVFEEWMRQERERLRLSALRMLFALSVHYMTHAEYSLAIVYAERVLSIEPCHEEAHRHLMSLLALSGQQSAAIRQYGLCCEALRDQFNLPPGEMTKHLYERIRRSTLDDREVSISTQYRQPSAPLIGRANELESLFTHLRNPVCRLLTVMGAGGVGKTRLAKEVAIRLNSYGRTGDEPAERVYFIPLGSHSSMESFIPAIAHGVGLHFSQKEYPQRQLLSFLSRRAGLLILDGCELLLDHQLHGMDGFVAFIERLADTAPKITVMVTSRVRLNLPHEIIFPLAGMAYPDTAPMDTGSLPDFDAIQLFVWQMSRFQPGIELAEADLLAIAGICQMTQGLPFAIVLIANWTRVLSPAKILIQLARDSVTTVESDCQSGACLAEEQTNSLKMELKRKLAPIFERSWRLLALYEQRTLAMLSVFSGGFNYDIASTIYGVPLSDMIALLDQSVVVRLAPPEQICLGATDRSRYGIHDLLRGYVEEQPDMTAVLGDARARHGLFYMAALERWAAELKGPGEQTTLLTLDDEIANVWRAWLWAIEQGRFDLLERGLEGLCRFCQLRYRVDDGESACRVVLASLSSNTECHSKLQSMVLTWLSWFTADRREALGLLNDSLKRSTSLSRHGVDTRTARALAFFMYGRCLLHSNIEQSGHMLERSLALYRELGDEWGIAQVLAVLHIHAWETGEHQKGRQAAFECMARYRSLDYMKGYAGVLGDLGIGALHAGLVDEGLKAINESYDVFQCLDDQAGMVKGLYYIGIGLGFLGKLAGAEEQLKRCASMAEENSHFAESVLIALATVQTHAGKYAAAKVNADAGLKRAKEIDNQMCIGRALTVHALVALAEHEVAEAVIIAQEAIAIYSKLGMKTELGTAIAALGYAACQRGDLHAAERHFTAAQNLAETHKDRLSQSYANRGFALLALLRGDTVPALEIDAMASRQPLVANSIWFHEMAKC